MLKNKKKYEPILIFNCPGETFFPKDLIFALFGKEWIVDTSLFHMLLSRNKNNCLGVFLGSFYDFPSVYVNKTMSRGNARPEKYDFSCRMK